MKIIEINKLNSLVELFFKRFEEINKDKPFLKWLKSDNPTYSWNDIAQMIFKLTETIETLIQKGDRCLILSENRPYWFVSDIAIMNAGGVSVPIFTTYSTKDYEYILKDCKPSIIIVSNNDQFKKVKNFVGPEVKKIISFEKIEFKSLLMTDILKKTDIKKKINKNLKRSMPACIIYTSGTSGNPKGVILSHGGILSNCEGAFELLLPLIKKKVQLF